MHSGLFNFSQRPVVGQDVLQNSLQTASDFLMTSDARSRFSQIPRQCQGIRGNKRGKVLSFPGFSRLSIGAQLKLSVESLELRLHFTWPGHRFISSCRVVKAAVSQFWFLLALVQTTSTILEVIWEESLLSFSAELQAV